MRFMCEWLYTFIQYCYPRRAFNVKLCKIQIHQYNWHHIKLLSILKAAFTQQKNDRIFAENIVILT